MTFAKPLLAGAASCALCAATAASLAAPHMHVAGVDNLARQKAGSLHMKSRRVQGDLPNITYTITFSLPLPPLETKTLLWAETRQNPQSCKPPKRETLTVPKKTKVARISVGSSTGTTSACPDSTFRFYGPVYDLEKQAANDSFTGSLKAKRYSGYNLVLNAHTVLYSQ